MATSFDQLKREAVNLERQLEEKIEQLEAEMGKTDFYGSDREQKVMAEYDTKKAELDKTMEIWEEAVMELEEFDESH